MSELYRRGSRDSPSMQVYGNGFTAQELLQLNVALKYGVVRKRNSKINIGKWPQKFIVLLKESIYVYQDETSKSTSQTLMLKGYNRVQRIQSKIHSWCFAVLPEVKDGSAKVHKFSCITDEERQTWMSAIRTQLYEANNIPSASEIRSSQYLGDIEHFYNLLEKPVFFTEGAGESVFYDNESEDDLVFVENRRSDPVADRDERVNNRAGGVLSGLIAVSQMSANIAASVSGSDVADVPRLQDLESTRHNSVTVSKKDEGIEHDLQKLNEEVNKIATSVAFSGAKQTKSRYENWHPLNPEEPQVLLN